MDIHHSRYALLRSYRRDGTPIDTPIWFATDGTALMFRTKVGPKTTRLRANPAVELRACDYRGRVRPNASPVAGLARILTGAEAEQSNRILHRRYGWQYNIVPLVKVPGITSVHSGLSWGEKVRRARSRTVWPDSAIVRIEVLSDPGSMR